MNRLHFKATRKSLLTDFFNPISHRHFFQLQTSVKSPLANFDYAIWYHNAFYLCLRILKDTVIRITSDALYSLWNHHMLLRSGITGQASLLIDMEIGICTLSIFRSMDQHRSREPYQCQKTKGQYCLLYYFHSHTPPLFNKCTMSSLLRSTDLSPASLRSAAYKNSAILLHL